MIEINFKMASNGFMVFCSVIDAPFLMGCNIKLALYLFAIIPKCNSLAMIVLIFISERYSFTYPGSL
jgi:hypothetical protein